MSNTKGSILISNANAVGTALVNKLGGTGYKPSEWGDAVNIMGITSADIPTALANITEGSYTGSERGAIKYSNCNAVGSMLNKKFSTDRGFKPVEWESAISKLTPLAERTVSGDICNIQDGSDRVPVKSWEVEIAPTLTGKSAIECTQTGKNWFYIEDSHLFPRDNNTIVENNTTFTAWAKVRKNTTYYVKKSGDTNRQNVFGCSSVPAVGVITNLISSTGIGNNTYYFNSGDYEYIGFYYSNEASEHMMMSLSQEEVNNYEPYTAPTVSTVNLGRTIYGGTADIVKGEGSETYARIDLGTLNYTLRNGVGMQSNGVSSLIQNPPDNYTKTTAIATDYTADTWQIVMNSGTSSGLFGVSGGYICFATTETDAVTFKASMSGKYLVFPLATPTDFTFSPITPTPETALGVNNFWADEGDSEVTYRKDPDIPDTPVQVINMNNNENNDN